MNDEKLFNEFPPVSTEDWERVIQADLKGADYEKKLIWKTDEGFKVRPYYRAEDLSSLDYLDSLPGQYPFVRGRSFDKNDWQIVQEVNEPDPVKANEIALGVIDRGATTVSFDASAVRSAENLKKMLNGIDLEKTGIRFRHVSDYVSLITLFAGHIEETKKEKSKIQGGIDFDPIAYLLQYRKFYSSRENDMRQLVELIRLTKDMPLFKVVNINGFLLHNAGAFIVQELAYTLSIANEYFAFALSEGISADLAASKMEATLSVGSNYFMEIAKLRAIRLLWSTMVEQYHPQNIQSAGLFINSVASLWNKTIYDPYVNMLRTTTEGMSAAIGGADSITLQPFDIVYKQEDDFSRRISRNVQIILKEESFFDKVVDPSAGSYYIENLTDSISEHAWRLFQSVEGNGGMIECINSGEIQKEIEKSCQKRDMDIATRRSILLGTNQYPNTQESMLDKVRQDKIREETQPGLKTYRGARAFEDLRLETEEYAKTHGRPKVFLLKVGNLAMRQARAGFVTNFFGCAGYEISDNTGFSSIEEGIAKAFDEGADLIVMCSSDEEYGTLGIEAARKIKEARPGIPFVIAGHPADFIADLKEAGADDFIHVKSNVLDTLRNYNQRLLNKK